MRPKHIFITVFVLLIRFSVSGQPLEYLNIGFDDALKMAKESKQIIFIQLTSNCNECDVVADQGLSGKQVAEVFKDFIKIKVPHGSDDFINISKKYRISPYYPTSLFLNEEGHFISMMYNVSTSFSPVYIEHAAKAMANKNNPPLAVFTKKYESGKYDTAFLKDYISELNKHNFNTNDLLEDYVNTLTIKDLYTPDEIKFIIQSAPLINSKVYKLMRFDYALYDSTFMTFPGNERAVINNRIIEKSRKKAFDERDVSYMNQVANFVQGTHAPGSPDGRKSRELSMLRYFKEVKDSANYISSARRFYQMFLDNVNVDSISAIEKSSFIRNENGSRMSGGKLYETGNQINELAWTIYELSSDPEHLGLALKWSERTLVYQYPPYHDTYAHILYKLGAREKAIEWQEKAVKLGESAGIQNINLRAELEKMKNGVTF